MSPQDRKYFRFRFLRVFALIFLLTCSPTQASSGPTTQASSGPTTQASGGPKGCAALESSWTANDTVSLVRDPKFIKNLAECFKEVKEAGGKLSANLQLIIKQIPELIEKSLPVAKEGGLVLLSVYVLYKSYELFNRMLDSKIAYTRFHDDLEALKEKVKPYQDFIATELIPQWEKGNTSNIRKVTDELLEKTSGPLTDVEELIDSIYGNATKVGSDTVWSNFYSVVALGACMFSIAGRNVPASVFVCGVGSVVIFNNYYSNIGNNDTLTKLDMLRKDANTLRKEITKYRSQLDIAKIRDELYI